MVQNVESLDRETIEKIRKQLRDWAHLRAGFDVPSERWIESHSLLEMSEHVDLSRPVYFESHRKIIGPFIVFFKKAFQRMIRPVIKIYFQRQILFNSYAFNYISIIGDLKRKIDELEKQNKMIMERLDLDKKTD
ncbi:MAG: hypothetical protein HQK54_09050 [Oligoflexales bacterium]|nr:hypothetical protein [Oligoflexales bacterium]